MDVVVQAVVFKTEVVVVGGKVVVGSSVGVDGGLFLSLNLLIII